MPDFSEHFTGTNEEILTQLEPLHSSTLFVNAAYEVVQSFLEATTDTGNYGVDITGHVQEGDNDGLRDGLWVAIYPAQTPVTPPNE